jgi:hypothetical protein
MLVFILFESAQTAESAAQNAVGARQGRCESQANLRASRAGGLRRLYIHSFGWKGEQLLQA